VFLRQNKDAFPNAPEPSDPFFTDGWKVTTEWSIAYGAMDLVVSSSRLGYLWVIENKLRAGEQPDQLARYSSWLHRWSKYSHRALFFLTPDGRPSSTSGGAVYHRLSYRSDIVAWLEEALPKVKAPRLVDFLMQYLEVLYSLQRSLPRRNCLTIGLAAGWPTAHPITRRCIYRSCLSLPSDHGNRAHLLRITLVARHSRPS
jgi:hypothetical protein